MRRYYWTRHLLWACLQAAEANHVAHHPSSEFTHELSKVGLRRYTRHPTGPAMKSMGLLGLPNNMAEVAHNLRGFLPKATRDGLKLTRWETNLQNDTGQNQQTNADTNEAEHSEEHATTEIYKSARTGLGRCWGQMPGAIKRCAPGPALGEPVARKWVRDQLNKAAFPPLGEKRQAADADGNPAAKRQKTGDAGTGDGSGTAVAITPGNKKNTNTTGKAGQPRGKQRAKRKAKSSNTGADIVAALALPLDDDDDTKLMLSTLVRVSVLLRCSSTPKLTEELEEVDAEEVLFLVGDSFQWSERKLAGSTQVAYSVFDTSRSIACGFGSFIRDEPSTTVPPATTPAMFVNNASLLIFVLTRVGQSVAPAGIRATVA
eukprot:g17387.t1